MDWKAVRIMRTETGVQGTLRLTRRGRIVLLLLTALVLSMTVVLVPGFISSATADSPSAPVAVEVFTIEQGQSLWHLASAITAPGDDVRDAVAVLVDLNNLATVDLEVGQQLLVPAA